MSAKGLGLPLIAVVGLAALGVPRVVAHDLRLVGPSVNALLVFVPIAVWLAVVLWKRVPNAFVTLLAVGAAYGVLLGLTHQVLWAESFGGDPPSLGGNLAGGLSPAVEALLLRAFAFGSSLMTGLAVGAAVGAVGWVLSRLVPGLRPGND
ncbi:hypothetical protein [Nonomuraea sp. SBT364]|uniref:hypothetical protein n=1 Tax=Nonomuraea sp. SBT364 TaxID=1580530 RepID=UPI00066A4A6E|nr:hypothetical protein [Nonomuraea sp. SBT364]